MKRLILTFAFFTASHAMAAVPFCNIAQLNPDGTPTMNSAVKEFVVAEKLVLATPNKDAELIAGWNDSYGFYQMTLVAKGIIVNSVIERPAQSGHLNLWMSSSENYTAQCRFDFK
jgi:hypothetical protein